MSCDTDDNATHHKARVLSGGIDVRVASDIGMRDDELRIKAAIMLLSGAVTPDIIEPLRLWVKLNGRSPSDA